MSSQLEISECQKLGWLVESNEFVIPLTIDRSMVLRFFIYSLLHPSGSVW